MSNPKNYRAGVAFALVFAMNLAIADCDQTYAEIKDEAMALDYQGFDQTPGQGFRILAGIGCARQAADLIEAYIETNNATERSLIWHLAQMRGEAGQAKAALEAARESLDPEETNESPFRWNAHVQAYIAFLKGDRSAFDASLDELENTIDRHAGNGINARFWRQLEPNFEQGYADAITRSK